MSSDTDLNIGAWLPVPRALTKTDSSTIKLTSEATAIRIITIEVYTFNSVLI